mmetsp:Transcript_25101/g.54771  ORF Transcript_25101/g.54771 Transcript_25101/m.54771 type:complete len:574 (-) Transcript_25101:95-1816(-)
MLRLDTAADRSVNTSMNLTVRGAHNIHNADSFIIVKATSNMMTSRVLVIITALFCHASFVAPNVAPRTDSADSVDSGKFRKVHPEWRRLELTKKQVRRKVRRKEKRQQKKEEARKQQKELTTPPTVTSEPSIRPTSSRIALIPTSIPSLIPRVIVTDEPSYSPSQVPTTYEPSPGPSATPTTDAPTESPSKMPSQRPTFHPSESPSAVPSRAPSFWPSSTPSNLPVHVATRVSCDGNDGSSVVGLSLAIIRFKYELQYKPSSEADAISFAEASVAQAIADEFVSCPQNMPERRLSPDEISSFDLVAVDSLPMDTVSFNETCTSTPEEPKWDCVVVDGAITSFSKDEDDATINVNEIKKVIEEAAMAGNLNLPNTKSRVTYIAQSEPLQLAPSFIEKPDSSATTTGAPSFVYGIAVAAAFLGSAAFALFIYYRSRRPYATEQLQADSQDNMEQPVEYCPNGTPSDAGSDYGASSSYLSDDTFWRTILSKGPSSNDRARHARQEEASDASIALSSIGVSFRGALGDGLEDDIDIESCGSNTVEDPYLRNDTPDGGKGKGAGKRWIDRLGIFADPE